MDVTLIGMWALLVFGFGFVIFWHELGHFLAAKWAGVKVEQFAVGFGQAMFSWRKGMGFRWGSSRVEFEQRQREFLRENEARIAEAEKTIDLSSESRRLDYANQQLSLGETEYRLNWIPLGGYVKMLGQDDMDPNAKSDSPRAYNNKPIGQRMVIVSAGVIMNIILAIILFTVLFRMGFDAPPPIVGSVQAGSPAQMAGIEVGDEVLTLDGKTQHDFHKIAMNVALLGDGEAVPMVVRKPDGSTRTLTVTPKPGGDATGFLKLGISPTPELRGEDPAKLPANWQPNADYVPRGFFDIKPGDVVTAVDGQPVAGEEYYKLDRRLQASYGRPISLTVRDKNGNTREQQIQPLFSEPFAGASLNLLGMVPRASIMYVVEGSAAAGKLRPGDIVVSLTLRPNNDTIHNPSPAQLRKALGLAADTGSAVDITVRRDGAEVTLKDLSPQTKLDDGGRGLGIAMQYDSEHAVVGQVLRDTAADRAQIQSDSRITSVNGRPVKTWYDVHAALAELKQPGTVQMIAETPTGAKPCEVALADSDLKQLASIRYEAYLALRSYSRERHTSNPLTAAAWGIAETRDLTLQFYLTIRRMVQGSISPKNALGPIGIFHAGGKFAGRGMDWLVWFLAMISANLAVVNFLPIPIVDGGLFVFLILEKVMGRPLSPRAQGIAQIAGLILLATVVLFVTYNDIRRIF